MCFNPLLHDVQILLLSRSERFLKVNLIRMLQGDAFSCKASPLPKQSTGLFGNSPLVKEPSG